MAVSISSLPYGDRSRDLFIDSMVKSAAVLNRFRLIDGVKAKVNVPIFDAALTFGTDLCTFDPQSTASVGEKEMTVDTFKWAFKNCKNALESSYRGLLLKKGQHNPETMDAEFKDWVYDYFAKLAANKALELASSELRTELAADTDVIDYDIADASGNLSSANILDEMEGAYQAMSDIMLAAVYGDADRDFKPAFFVGTVALQHYQIAIAEKFTTTPQGIIEGNIPPYFGMEVVHLPSLNRDEMIISAPQNLVMLTDDYNDVRAIDMEYEARENSDLIWGQFKLGFSYLKGEEIVYVKNA